MLTSFNGKTKEALWSVAQSSLTKQKCSYIFSVLTTSQQDCKAFHFFLSIGFPSTEGYGVNSNPAEIPLEN
jgi:hypothetical protein